MLYDDWQARFASVSRGAQQWDSRQRVYAWLSARASRRLPTVAATCRGARVSLRTFYKHFGLSADSRLVEDEPIAVAIVEAKEWSFAPYRHGVRDIAEQVTLDPQTLLEALVRAVAEWAGDHPALAGHLQARPPTTAVVWAADTLAAAGGDRETALDLLRGAVELAADDTVAQPSLAVLNTLRPTLETALGQAHASPAGDRHLAVVEVLSEYVDDLLAGTASVPTSADSELRSLLDRLRAVIEETG